MNHSNAIITMLKGIKRYLCLPLLVSMVCITGISIAEAVELALLEAVTVQENVIYMRDLVTPEIDSAELTPVLEALLAAPVCKAPQAGKSRSLSRRYIVMKLKNQDIVLDTVRFSGARTVKVRREATVLSLEEIKAAVRTYLVKHYGIDPAKTKIHFENLNEDLVLPDGTIKYAIEEMPAGFRHGTFSFRLALTSDGKLYKKKMISAKITERCPIVIAAERIGARETIMREKVMLKEVPVENSNYYFSATDEVIGTVATVMCRAGEPIKRAYIRTPPLIRKGTLVSATFNHKNMHVELTVRALEDGMRGSLIPVYSEATRKRFSATVISADNVEVVL